MRAWLAATALVAALACSAHAQNYPSPQSGGVTSLSGPAQFAPAYSSGGGGAATFGSTATAAIFRVTTSSTASTSVTVAMPGWAYTPRCVGNPEQATTTGLYLGVTAPSGSTAATVVLTWTGSVASAVFDVICQ